jgi:hypothetical protein
LKFLAVAAFAAVVLLAGVPLIALFWPFRPG